MIDLHLHTILSDGVLVPAELIRRCAARGYRALALTDHVDHSNLERVVAESVAVARAFAADPEIFVIPGVEITHVPPRDIPRLVARARDLGALVVLVHGETLVEPVAPGTNRAAVEAGADVLAHPGLIAPEEVEMAVQAGVRLELSGRKGHSLTNGHVAAAAREAAALLSFGSDGHAPGDFPDRALAVRILRGAGLTEEEAAGVLENNLRLLDNARARLEWDRRT